MIRKTAAVIPAARKTAPAIASRFAVTSMCSLSPSRQRSRWYVEGRDQEGRGDGGAEEGDEVHVALHLRDVAPAVRERDDEQEGEQHLDAGKRDPELVQELDQLAVEVVLAPLLVVAHRNRSRSAGMTRSFPLPSPVTRSPRTTAAGMRESFPITSSAAPAISSATAIVVACSS